MTISEFLPYQNHHIRFKLKDGKELSGVIMNNFKHLDTKEMNTHFSFVPTSKMIDWKHAERKYDTEKMKSLQIEIDILNIVWAERMIY